MPMCLFISWIHASSTPTRLMMHTLLNVEAARQGHKGEVGQSRSQPGGSMIERKSGYQYTKKLRSYSEI
jgi:hypothetical protein